MSKKNNYTVKIEDWANIDTAKKMFANYKIAVVGEDKKLKTLSVAIPKGTTLLEYLNAARRIKLFGLEPRILSDDEIKRFLQDTLPMPRAGDRDTAESIRVGII